MGVGVIGLAISGALAPASAELLLYDPFDYTPGAFLGGTDDDGAGPNIGTPIGQTNAYTGGGTWYARDSNQITVEGQFNNYQSQFDATVSAGSLSYPGLAAGVGNSVSYGSTTPASSAAPYYTDSIAIPGAPITSGSLYASFIVRIKSPHISGTTGIRTAMAGFLTDLTDESLAGTRLTTQESSGGILPAGFWMRRDPVNTALSNFSPGKSPSDGIGPAGGIPASQPSAGWQHSNPTGATGGTTFVESNQFGDVDGQPLVNAADPNSFQTYFVVLKYEFNTPGGPYSGQNDTVSLWMNPGSGTLGSATGEADASQAAAGNLGSYFGALRAFGTVTSDVSLAATGSINSFGLIGYLRTVNTTIAVDFDELRIGTTWASVTPAATETPTGDFDGDGDADGHDFLTWQSNYGRTGAALNQGDADLNGTVNDADFAIWKSEFGQTNLAAPAGSAVPEPTSLAAALFAIAAAGALRRPSTL